MDEGELREAFAQYVRHARAISACREWHAIADLLTEDAVYRRSGHRDLEGREAIRNWILEMTSVFPGNRMHTSLTQWHAVEPATGRVLYEMRNYMEDPGDGSVHEARTVSVLTYGGAGLWRLVEDQHSPVAYAEMVRRWVIAARRCGTLDAVRQG